ncbi:MAG: HAMP domain-containing protein [Cytophagaceae bacterium]|nr:HAMP domain-containing protein [Cytophagaceae bacterium]
MNIKSKLTLGVGFLFSMIAILAAVSAWYIHALKSDTTNILTANYNTLEYSRSMLMALEEIPSPDAVLMFEESLNKQQYNITEIGEKEITEKITQHFDKLKNDLNDSVIKKAIRADITEVMRLNMQAIQRKSQVAVATSETATFWIAVSGTVCFLLAFILLINLPSTIANPIRELNESIKQIADQKYSERVHFKGSSEFEELAKSFNKMAQKLEEYNNSNLSLLLIEKKRIDTLINNMNDPVIGLDEHQKIIFANNEALKILDVKQNEVIGHQASKLALTNDLLRSLLKEALLPVSADKTEPVKIYSNGKESYFQKEIVDISIVPTGESTALTIGKVIILRNITHFKELDFAKTNFIATVSHELKTPISSIKMSLQLLENKNTGAINSGQEQLIESIKEDSNRLLKITSELLNLSQIETGNIQLNLHKAKPLEVVNYALQAVQTQAQQKQIVMEIIHGDSLSEMRADAEKTTWVLINFLTNAIRYSPEQSKIKIAIKQEGATVSISVIDEGKGIDERYKNRIFDRYFQIPGSSKTGTGLGLTISKEFIEAQGGEIGLTSEMGMGSTFYFKLPVY